MKKLLSLLLVLAMAFLMVGCSSDSDKKDDDTEDLENAYLTRGKISGDVYTNEIVGFTFRKPDSWIYATDAEMEQTFGIAAELLGDQFANAAADNLAIYDMLVRDMYTGTNINVSYENLKKTLSSNITVNQYIDAMKNQFAQITSIQVEFPDTYKTVKIGGKNFTKVECNTISAGINIKQVFYIYKIDGYMVNIVVTIPSGYTVSQIEDMFT